MKKLTSIILSVGLILNIFCTLGITVSADNTNVEVNSEGDTSSYVLKYNELSDGTLEVCGFENNTSEVGPKSNKKKKKPKKDRVRF